MDEQRIDVRNDGPVPGHPSRLDEVVVYASGALCRRRATVPLPADGRLRLTGLPRLLDARSLRARVVAGPPGVLVTEARVEPAVELRPPSDLPELRRELEEARERTGALNERLRLVRATIAETAALRAVPPPRRRDETHRRTPADAWLELAEFVDERLAGLQERDEELTRQLERAEHAQLLLEERLDSASTAEPTEPVETSATVLLTLSTTGTPSPTDTTDTTGADRQPPARIELELEYGVPAARWLPAYRLAYRQGSDTGQLVLRASVAQRTGEDWTGVRLALSTADLQRRTDLPKLRSLRIGRSQPAPAPSGWREPPSGLADLFAGFDAAGPRPVPERAPIAVAAAMPVTTAHAVQAFDAPRAGGTLAADNGDFLIGAPPPPPAFGGYGGPPPPAPAAPGGPAPEVRRARPRIGAAAPAPAPAVPQSAFAPQAVPAPAPPAPPVPDPSLLDYPALVLAGPEEPAARRGRLHPADRDPFGGATAPGARQVQDLPLPRHCVPPRTSAGSFDHRFDAAAPADIPSDATWHTVTVAEIPVSLSPEYVTVPSVEEKVYATLVVANRTAQAILAGPVEVTVDGEFLLTAGLPTLAPGGTRRLGLGVTEGIEVARRTELRESTAGMLNNSTVLNHQVHVELANRLGHAVTVEVRERVPVTSEADIRIEERGDWQAPAKPSAEVPASARLWRVELPPGGRTELHGGFEIRIPAGKAIVGGNRRN